jgi:hypothetical protein
MRSYDVLNSMSDETDDIMSLGQITTETKGAPAGGKPDLVEYHRKLTHLAA